MNRSPARLLVLSLILCLGATLARASEPVSDPTPPGVQQILPRGDIPAIFDPVFVPADQAEIPDDAWVLGVELDGVAKAYSLNLLNQHEVVNDRFGDKPIAAVW